MGQIGIRSILKMPLQTELRSELNSQLKEYDAIEREAHGIALSRGWELKELNPAIKGMTNMMTRSQLSFGDMDSKAAAMMIRGNTRGVIKGYKNMNQFAETDKQVSDLAYKLIDFEQVNNHQLQGYL